MNENFTFFSLSSLSSVTFFSSTKKMRFAVLCTLALAALAGANAQAADWGSARANNTAQALANAIARATEAAGSKIVASEAAITNLEKGVNTTALTAAGVTVSLLSNFERGVSFFGAERLGAWDNWAEVHARGCARVLRERQGPAFLVCAAIVFEKNKKRGWRRGALSQTALRNPPFFG